MTNNCEKNGCPPGTDLRTCKTALAGQCPFLLTHGPDGGQGLFYCKRQQDIFHDAFEELGRNFNII